MYFSEMFIFEFKFYYIFVYFGDEKMRLNFENEERSRTIIELALQ